MHSANDIFLWLLLLCINKVMVIVRSRHKSDTANKINAEIGKEITVVIGMLEAFSE